MATSQKLGWIIRSMPWFSILERWGGLGAQRLHKMGHKAELGGEASWLGTSLWEGRFPLYIKREEVIIWTEPLLYCDHHCLSPKSESIRRGKKWNITRFKSHYILTGKRSKWGWLRMKDRQQKGSQHVPLWQTIINGLCKVIPSALTLYLWLDVFSGCIKILPKTIAV